MKRIFKTFVLLVSVFLAGCSLAERTPPQGVILFIGDGMGFEQVKAASLYAGGAEGSLSFEHFPFQGESVTRSADSAVTDSAAGATAMAAGVKVNNGVISLKLPGDGSPLTTLTEEAKAAGMFTAVLTTAFVTHATPAAFLAHVGDRNLYEEIGRQIFTAGLPDVILGGGGNGVSPELALVAGYTVVRTALDLAAYKPSGGVMLSGQFGDTHLPYVSDGRGELPSLAQMLDKTLEAAALNSEKGFFIMVEGGRIDHAGHGNDLQRCVLETIDFAEAVQAGRDWAATWPAVSLLVTADHETGGLAVLAGRGAGELPLTSWSTTGHTGVNVPVYGFGSGMEAVNGKVMENTDIYRLLREVLFP